MPDTILAEPQPVLEGKSASAFGVTFFDAAGKPLPSEITTEELLSAEPGAGTETLVYENPEKNVVMAREVTTAFKICHIDGVPDVKTEIVYRKIHVLGKTIRVPTVAVRKRFCSTDFVAEFTVADEKLRPMLLECSVAAAVVAAPIIIGGCATGIAAPAALAAGLEAFTQSVAACVALRGFDRKLFDVALRQNKSCSAWEPMV